MRCTFIYCAHAVLLVLLLRFCGLELVKQDKLVNVGKPILKNRCMQRLLSTLILTNLITQIMLFIFQLHVILACFIQSNY